MSEVILKNLTKSFNGEKVLQEINLTIKSKEFMVLVGPSGCGKTTLLRTIAGLESCDEGSIKIGNKDVTNLEAKDRNIAMVFQNYALYPHMSVFGNMEFPLKIAKIKKEERKNIIYDTAKKLKIDTMLHKRPAELSGGQKQRVAIGRALVRKPDVFLFDEPLSNLDARLREEMRYELAQLHQELQITSIYVTHDQHEAMTLGNKIAILNKGNLIQYGSPSSIYKSPTTLFTADFLGSPSINLISGKIDGKNFIGPDFRVEDLNLKTDYLGKATIGIRPDDISIDTNSSLQGEVSMMEDLGSSTLVHLQTASNKKIKIFGKNFGIQIGDVINFSINKSKILIYDKNGHHIS